MKPFYNTNKESGKELARSTAIAIGQEEKIVSYFKKHPSAQLTPFEVRDLVFDQSVPVTSVRRAMTNLTDKSILKKTDAMRTGRHGKKNHTWKLVKQTHDIQLKLGI
jgi:hypothetical protein